MTEKRKAVVFIATTLDGYIATKEESLDWLFSVEGEGDNGFGAFYNTVDTVIMGRRTYDWIIKEMDAFPYQGKACYVFTNQQQSDTPVVQFVHGDVSTLVRTLKEQPGKDIWIVGGGGLIKDLLDAGELDKLIVTIAPRLIGNGIPLFWERHSQTDLQLKNIQQFGGFVELTYEV